MTYMNDTNNNRHLHLVRVGEDERIVGAMPAGIEAKGIYVASVHEIHDSRILNRRHLPARMEEVQRFREDIVVDEAGVDGEQAHEEDDVTTAVRTLA